MPPYDKPHVNISELGQGRNYTSDNSRVRARVIQRIRDEHGPRIAKEYRTAFDAAIEQRPAAIEGLDNPEFVALRFEIPAQAPPAQLERTSEKTRQAAVSIQDNGAQGVVLLIPDNKREVLDRLLEEYISSPTQDEDGNPKNPKNNARISQIDAIRAAEFRDFWKDDPEQLPADAEHEMWWGLWCYKDRVDIVVETATRLGARVSEPDNHLVFPDVKVVQVYASKFIVEILAFGTFGVEEIRLASDNPIVFLRDLEEDSLDWVNDLAERIEWPPLDAPAICILDTGVNRGHPLLEPILAPEHMGALSTVWGVDDHDGHGTGMAGLAGHGDLTAQLADTHHRSLNHRLESVKIMPPNGFEPNELAVYGALTQSAISIAEINNPTAPSRVFCLAITNRDKSGAVTSTWSAAIDQASAGAMPGDDDEDPLRRLIIVSTGNVHDEQALDALEEPDAFPAQDPSQAWNALTVGGFTDKTTIYDTGYEHWSACARPGELSPYSCSSFLWQERKSPSKPDVVFEAGNRAVNQLGTETMAGLPSLSLLSTGHEVDDYPFDLMWATSAATAQASRMAAKISASNTDYWPETVRALMVHSADWTEPMKQSFGNHHRSGDRVDLVRRFGFGVPNLNRALASAENDLALISQRYIQPFYKDGSVKLNEAHVYPLPWPTTTLQDLGETPVRLKVTLSYFVEPNPSFSSEIDPNRYQSFGLRFDLKRELETKQVFLKRRNVRERLDGERAPATQADSGWLLGDSKVVSGSLLCDVWEGTAAQLATRDHLWVYPVNGWWRERKSLEKFSHKARYALVITLDAPEIEIDLHTEISAMVEPLIGIEIS